MRRFTKIGVTAALVGASVVGLHPAPASAGATVTVSGTTITVALTGNYNLGFACSSGNVWAGGAITSPALACSALTKVTVTGDASPQDISGSTLSTAPFTAHPYLVASTGGGADTVRESLQADQIDTGPGADRLVLYPGGPTNTSLATGTELDHVAVEGSPADETIQALSSNTSLSLSLPGPSSLQAFHTVSGAEWLELSGGAGNDILTATGVGAASSIDTLELQGGDGNDSITSGPVPSTTMDGGTGTNALVGSDADDEIYTESDTDDITPGKGLNHIYDHKSLRAGGRSLHGVGGAISQWDLQSAGGDAVIRVREGAGSSAEITTSLNRPGRQVGLNNSVTALELRVDDEELDSEPATLGLVDVVALPIQKQVRVHGEGGPKELVDVTVPTFGWTTEGTPGGTYTIKPTNSGSALYGYVVITGISNVSVHGTWANYNEGWAHRMVRDLQFRFPSAGERANLRDLVGSGTKTRAQIVASMMDSDIYRGLDVDRVFVKFLRRTADPSGRTYWINSLDGGKSLLLFRAQLFGSNEYFTKAGGANAPFMVKAYNDVMGRAPDPSGQAYWTNKLDNGADRGAVVREFLKSTEARRNIVKDQFLRFLDRYPTATAGGESETWVTKLAEPTGELQLIAMLASSSEYQART